MSYIPKRILLTNMYGGIGGGEICLLHHLRHLRSNNAEVLLLILEHGQLEVEARAEGAAVVVQDFAWRGGKIRSVLALAEHVLSSWNLIRRFKPEVVCCYTFNDFVLAGIAARLAGVPVVWRTQGEIVPEKSNSGTANWLGDKFPTVIRYIRPAIASTTNAEAEALKAMKLGARSIECIYLGTPVTDFEAPAIRPVLKFGLFGRLVEWKGQHVFIGGLAELKKRGYQFEAIIVGSGAFGDGPAYEQRLNNLILQHGLLQDVKLLGFRRDVPDLMRECDVICHCSSFEPFGMVIIESMMLGRPVIATAVRGPRESVVDGKCGYLVRPGSEDDLADAMEKMIKNEVMRQKMGLEARSRALSMFSLTVSMEALDGVVAAATDG